MPPTMSASDAPAREKMGHRRKRERENYLNKSISLAKIAERVRLAAMFACARARVFVIEMHMPH